MIHILDIKITIIYICSTEKDERVKKFNSLIREKIMKKKIIVVLFGMSLLSSAYMCAMEVNTEQFLTQQNNNVQQYYPQQQNPFLDNQENNNTLNQIPSSKIKNINQQWIKTNKAIFYSCTGSLFLMAFLAFWYGYSGYGNDYGAMGIISMIINIFLFNKISDSHMLEGNKIKKVIAFLQNNNLIAGENNTTLNIRIDEE